MDGSITVFLALLLLLLMSFIFTTLEGARITASKSRLAMLSEMASDSLSSEYFYPLFKDYGLLAVDAGFGQKHMDTEQIRKELYDRLAFAYDNSNGCMLSGHFPSIGIENIETLLTSEKAGIRNQIRDEAVFEGAELFLEGLFDEPMLEAAEVLQEVYDKQAGAMESAAAVTSEILKLMTLIDGVATSESGLMISKDGEVSVASGFLKCFGIKDKTYMKNTYGDPRIYEAAKGQILYITDVIERTEIELQTFEKKRSLIGIKRIALYEHEREAEECNEKLETLYEEMTGLKEAKDKEKLKETERKIREIEKRLEDVLNEKIVIEDDIRILKEERDRAISKAKAFYEVILKVLQVGKDNCNDALGAVLRVRVKQEAAKLVVDDYEAFLKGLDTLPKEIAESLISDSINLKSYVTLESSGYDTAKMMQTLQNDLYCLNSMDLPAFNEMFIDRVRVALDDMKFFIDEMNYEGLKFNYSGLKGSTEAGEDVKKTLKKALSCGLLKFLGVEKVSEKALNGLDLPSGGEWGEKEEDLFEIFGKMGDFFKEGNPSEMIKKARDELSQDFLNEVYMAGHFSDHSAQRTDTMLCYEREYVLSGKKTDSENLASVAMKLVGLRSVFTFASLVADAERNGEATALASSVAGFTGLPALLYVVKYAILTTWALEEALVEVSALFRGKKVPIYSPTGRVTIGEIFFLTGEKVKEKAEGFSKEGHGITYKQYIILLSFFESLTKKELRIADLIQENMRLRYRDSFRIRNALTEVSFTSSVTLDPRFDTGFFREEAYKVLWKTSMCY